MFVRPSVASVYPASKPVSAVRQSKPSLDAPLFAGKKKQALTASAAASIQKPEASEVEVSKASLKEAPREEIAEIQAIEEAPQQNIAEIQSIEQESAASEAETPRSETVEAAQDSFSGDEDAVHINRLKRDELVSARQENKHAELITIGEKFKVPGRLWIRGENYVKACTRGIIHPIKEVTSNVTDRVCQTAAAALKSTAKAIEGFSSKPPEAN